MDIFNPQNYYEVRKEAVRNHKLYYVRIYFTERAGFFKFQNVIISFFTEHIDFNNDNFYLYTVDP